MAARWNLLACGSVRAGEVGDGAVAVAESAAVASVGVVVLVMRCTSRMVRWCSANATCSAALCAGSTSISIISVRSLPSCIALRESKGGAHTQGMASVARCFARH